MIAAAINGVRAVAAVFSGFMAASFAVIPLLAPGSQQSPTPVIVVAAVMAAGLAYALWPWHRRYSARQERSTTPVLAEQHDAENENEDNDLKAPLAAGEMEILAKILTEAQEAARQEVQRKEKDAAQAAERECLQLSPDEKRKAFRGAERSGGATNHRQLARKTAEADGHNWRELTKEQRQEYLRRARGEA